jgi:hypothetical protein
MKKFTLIIAALLTLHVNLLFAGNDNVAPVVKSGASISLLLNLAPVTPKEATFEDAAPAIDVTNLAPVTPNVADFEETTDTLKINIQSLKPVCPSEADFE